MFRAVFGRKPVVPAKTAIPVVIPDNAALALIARLDLDYPDYRKIGDERYMRDRAQRFWALSEETINGDGFPISDLFCAIAETGLLSSYKNENPITPQEVVISRLHTMLRHLTEGRRDFHTSPAIFRAVARLTGEANVWDYSHYASKAWWPQLQAIVEAGHAPTAEERGWLVQFRDKLKNPRWRRLRGELRDIDAMVRWIDTVCESAPDTVERLRVLATPTAEPGRFPAEPPHLRFWKDFLVRAAAHTARLMLELEETPEPAWLDDEAAYVARFPFAEGVSRPFGWWDDEPESTHFGQSGRLRGLGWARQRKQRAAAPAIYETALTARAELGALYLVWEGNAVPALERLANVSDRAQAALLLHLADAKNGPKPPTAWLATARRLAAAAGRDATQARLADWLAQFADAPPTDGNYARLHNYHELAAMAAWLEEVRPDLPGCADAALIDAAASAIASGAGGRYTDEGVVLADEHDWLGSARARAKDFDRGHLPAGMRDRWRPSISNEAILRGVIWLLADLAGAGAADLLERTALSAMAYSDSSGARSRGTANAVVAALARIGSPDALEALGRLRRSIKDKAIANAVTKAITGVAEKTGVAPADVEEMSVPDYGFA